MIPILIQILFVTTLTLLTSTNVFGEDVKKTEVSAVKLPLITVQYKGGSKIFSSPKIMITPYAQFIEFNSNGQKYVRDCRIVQKIPSHWLCKSPCSGGDLKVIFRAKMGFDVLTVPAFKIQPSQCETSSSANAPWIKSDSALVFQAENLGKI